MGIGGLGLRGVLKINGGLQRGEDTAVAAVLGYRSWQWGIAFQDCNSEGKGSHICGVNHGWFVLCKVLWVYDKKKDRKECEVCKEWIDVNNGGV